MSYTEPFSEIHVKYLVGGEKPEKSYIKEAMNDATTKYCSVPTAIDGKAKITFSYEVARA
jgi:uncharacterized OsmC-like protein